MGRPAGARRRGGDRGGAAAGGVGRTAGERRAAVEIGLNLDNREALIAPDYGLSGLLELACLAERRGFDSVWVGDSLLSKPRYEPLAVIGALSQRTETVRLGTACLITTLRHPVQLAHAWSTLDVASGGRT